MKDKETQVVIRHVEESILIIRGRKVMIDADLAALYGVVTKRLNEQVRRNKNRFPEDFMFQLTSKEKMELVANCDRVKNLRYSTALPHAFTEHGAIMLASVLNSSRAIEMSVYVVRAFVKLQTLVTTHKIIAQKVTELERKLGTHDVHIRSLFSAIRQLTELPKPTRK